MYFPANYAPWEICVTVTHCQTVQGGPTNNNVLMFVAGTLMAHGRWYYAISQVEFPGNNLTQQLGTVQRNRLRNRPTAARLGRPGRQWRRIKRRRHQRRPYPGYGLVGPAPSATA